MDYNEHPNYDTLKAHDMIVVVFATDDLDVKTTHLYGGHLMTDEEIVENTRQWLVTVHGEDAAKGLEILSVAV